MATLLALYHKHANDLPLGVHNWAQSDRFSVAVMYLDEVDFFTARTHNLSTIDGRCGVEFPAVQYISSRIAALTSPNWLPFIYRLTNLLILITGIWLFVSTWTVKPLVKIACAFLLFFSPVLAFYGFNFLPDTAGLGILLIGIHYFVRYSQKGRLNHALLSLFFAGLATLLKTTCGIYFLALAGTYGLHFIRPLQLKNGVKLLAGILVIMSVIIGYDYFFFHKVNTDFYSRIFMSQKQPLSSAADFRGFRKAIQYWHGQYLTWPQTILVFGLLVRSVMHRNALKPNTLGRNFILIAAIGLVSFLLLMGKQFINHDYYFIAAFLPLFCVLVWHLITIQLNVSFFSSNIFKFILIGLAVFTTIQAFNMYEKRMSSHFVWKHRNIINDIEWMENGEELIDEIGIPKDATLFIGYDAAPNTALVYFNRRGKVFNHEEMTRDSANMQYWSNRIRPDYYIFPNAWVSKLEHDQPWLYHNLVPFANRPNFVVFKPTYKFETQ